MERGPKVVFAILALSAAAASYAYLSKPDTIRESPKDLVYFKCIECGAESSMSPQEAASTKIFRLAAEEVEDLSTNGEPVGKFGRNRAGVSAIKCPSCQMISALPASKCPNDGTVFPQINRDLTSGECPKCGWSLEKS